MEAAVLIALIIFGLPIILSIVAMNKVGGLEKEIARLKSRLALLEKGNTPPKIETPSWASTAQPTDKSEKEAKPDESRSSPIAALENTASASKRAVARPYSAKTKPSKKSLEEMIGAQWSVWLGGLALLIGAVFLLRYSIEAGVFTPAMRVAMASAMGVILLAVGEWLHRSDLNLETKGKLSGLADGISKQAYIPTLLTAIAVFTLFGAVYAAYALYGFIGPVFAFILLGLISVGSSALSFRHGPILAAVGLVGALSVPLLIHTQNPNVYGLYGYIIAIAVVSLFVAEHRKWGWLHVATLFGVLFWSFMSIEAGKSGSQSFIWFAYLAVAFVVNAVIAERSEDVKIRPKGAGFNSHWAQLAHGPQVATIWAILAALAVLVVSEEAAKQLTISVLCLMFAAGLLAASWVFRRQNNYSLIGLGVAWLALVNLEQGEVDLWVLMVIGGGFALAFMAFSILRMKPENGASFRSHSTLWACIGTAFPLLFLGTLLGVSDVESETLLAMGFGLFALIFAALGYFVKGGQYKAPINAGVYIIGSALAYLAAVLLGSSGQVESVAIMMGMVIYAFAAWRVGGLIPRVLVPVFAFMSAGHSLTGPIEAGRVGEALILNSLWLYFALPCLLSAGAAWALSLRKSDIFSEGMKALSLSFAALFISFQIHHFMNDGHLLAYRLSFDELALHVLTGLSFTLGATQLTPRQWDAKGDLHTRILPMIAMAVSSLTLVILALGLCLAKSPLFNSAEIIRGNIVLNSLTLGYLLPGLLLAFIARQLKTRRPDTYIRVLGGLSLIALIFFIVGTIRFVFSGDEISIFRDFPTGFELYAISAAWLVFGIVLLVVGLKRKRQDLRLASGVLITLTVLKAFLIDMAELEGVLRALSFVVLGLILIIIGRSYQKILFSQSHERTPNHDT